MSVGRSARELFTGGGAPPPPRTDFPAPALGSHPQRELPPMPHLGCASPRLGMAAGADTFARISMSSLRCSRRRSCTGGGAPAPAAS